MRASHIGLLLGAILGIALVIRGFGEMLIVGLVAAIGWLVARVVDGEIDVSDQLRSRAERSSRR